jgi:hypothetical protein
MLMKSTLLIGSALALLATLNPQPSTAALGTAFTYQGRLADGGNPATGIYDLRFALYDALSSGAQVGSSLTNAATSVTNGYFTVTLDFGAVFTGNARWLEIGVRTNGSGAFATLAPRQPLTPSPYALYTPSAGAAATATTAGTANSVAAANVTGTLGIAQLPAALLTNNQSGVTLAGAFSGNGAGLTSIPFTALPTVPLTNNQSGVTLKGLTTVSNLSVSATNFVNYLVVTNPPALNGSAITNLNASQLASGSVSLSLLPAALVTNNEAGVGLTGSFTGNGAGLTNIPFSALPVVPLTNNHSGVTLKGLTTVSNLSVTATNFANYLVVTNPPWLNGSGITNLNASQLTAGTVPLALLPGAVVTNNETGLNLGGTFSGNGADLTNVNLMNVNGQGAITWATNWGNFIVSSTPGVGLEPVSLVAADVNGDNKLDLISANYMASTLSVLTNNGSGGFVLAATLNVGANPTAVTATDVNGDSKMDLISANYSASTLTVLTNNGSGGFVLAATLNVGSAPQSVTAADVNADGKVDLISANYLGSTLTVLTNNGSGGFVQASSPATPNPYSVTTADVNGDSKVDLICANASANKLSVLTNNGSGGFVQAVAPAVGIGPQCVAAVDVNGDSKPDLISANSGDNTLSILTNNGSGGFVLAATPGVGSMPCSVTAADLNADGKLDLVCANSWDNSLSVLTNKGGGGFVVAATLPASSSPYAVTARDVNGDGKADLISANGGTSSLSVLFNTLAYNATFHGTVAGDGSGLRNLDASQLAAGLVSLARLPGAVLTNNATGVNLSGTLAGNGAALTNINADQLDGQHGAFYQNAANLTSGALPDARLSANVALLNANQAFTGANRFAGVVTLTNTGNLLFGTGTFSGNGGGLTNLNAANLTATVADARLTTNVALLNASQSFTGTNLFGQRVGIGTTNPAQLLQVGDANTPGSQGMIRLGSRSPTNVAYRTWDIGVPQTGGDTTGVGYSFVIKDTLLGSDPQFLIRWNTGNVGIGRTNPATALDVNGTVTATGFAGNGALPWQTVAGTSQAAAPDQGYLLTNTAQVTLTLPAAPAVGDVVRVSGIGAGGWRIAQNAGQSVLVQTAASLSPAVIWTARESSRNWWSIASSADGTKLVATVYGGQIYTSSDSGATWTARATSRNWRPVASSADGTKLIAAVNTGQIYTSSDSGVTWTARASSTTWEAVASSADGTKLVAAVMNGQIWTSGDSGVTWTARASSLDWYAVASSADGTKLVAVGNGTQIWTSSDSGTNWTAHATSQGWISVASSSDGTKLVAAVDGSQLWTSSDSGTNWTARESNRNWASVASSADGTKLVAAPFLDPIYTSSDSGVTWTARDISRAWDAVASSADGTKLVAAVSPGQVYTSTPAYPLPTSATTVGTGGYLVGSQGAALELQYVGNGQFIPLSHEGTIFAY